MDSTSSSTDSAATLPFDDAIAREVDASGLNCPLPILKAKKALSEMQSGQVLRVISTDAGSKRDFESFTRQTGNSLIHQTATNARWEFFIRRR